MFLVVFRNRKRADIDAAAYSADAVRMEERARAQPGFLSFKSYVSDDGEVIALSEWQDRDAAHRQASPWVSAVVTAPRCRGRR